MKCCRKGRSTTVTVARRVAESSCAATQLVKCNEHLYSLCLKQWSFKAKPAIGLSSSSPYPGPWRERENIKFLQLHSMPLSCLSPPQLMTGLNTRHSAAPGSGWIQLSASDVVALLGLGKETRGPWHPLYLKKVRKHNLCRALLLENWSRKGGKEQSRADITKRESKESRELRRRTSPIMVKVRYPRMHSFVTAFKWQPSALQLHVLFCLVEGWSYHRAQRANNLISSISL